jgi:hypothetical protein
MAIVATDIFLEDLLIRRGNITTSGNANRFGIELPIGNGGYVVEMTPFEPDAATYRNWYYYNTNTNTLMRKVVLGTGPGFAAFWKKISQ